MPAEKWTPAMVVTGGKGGPLKRDSIILKTLPSSSTFTNIWQRSLMKRKEYCSWTGLQMISKRFSRDCCCNRAVAGSWTGTDAGLEHLEPKDWPYRKSQYSQREVYLLHRTEPLATVLPVRRLLFPSSSTSRRHVLQVNVLPTLSNFTFSYSLTKERAFVSCLFLEGYGLIYWEEDRRSLLTVCGVFLPGKLRLSFACSSDIHVTFFFSYAND